MLQPKRTKYRKAHKGRIKGAASSAVSLSFGSHGLKAQEPARVTARQIEAARRAMTRQMKRAVSGHRIAHLRRQASIERAGPAKSRITP